MARKLFRPGDQVVMNDLDDATIYEVISIHQRNMMEIKDTTDPRASSQMIDSSLANYPTLKQLTGE